jgi:hypothetical protein
VVDVELVAVVVDARAAAEANTIASRAIVSIGRPTDGDAFAS